MDPRKRRFKIGVSTFKTHYLHFLAFLLVLASILVVYGNDLGILANEALQNEALSHILLLPFFAGFLFYLKKDAVKAALSFNRNGKRKNAQYVDPLLGVAFCAMAFLIYWYGSYTFYPLEYHLFSLPIFVMGITLLLLNSKALRALIFPIIFLFFLIPIPATIIYTAGGTLANFNSQLSYSILKPLGVPVTLSSTYGAPTLLLSTTAGEPAAFTVDIPCSGLYSIIAFVMFAAFLIFLASTSLWKKFSIFLVGFFIFAVLNVARIIAVVTVAYFSGEGVAMFLHSFAGFVLIFIGMLITLFLAEKILKIRIMTAPKELVPCPKCQKNLLADFCQNCGRFLNKPRKSISKSLVTKLLLLLLVSSIVVLSIHAPTFATTQESIELSSGDNPQNATSVFPTISGYTLTFLYRDTEYEKISKQDASLIYGYFPENISDSTIYVDLGVSSSISNLHNWEVCLIGIQTAQGQYPLVNVLDSKDIQLVQDPPLVANFLSFDSPNNYTQVTLYWYAKAPFKTGLTVEQKYVRISLIILTQNSENYPRFEQKLLNVGQLIASEWEPLKTQALISLGVPALQALLLASVAFLIATISAQYLNEQRKTANNLKIFDKCASSKEKIVYQTVLKLAAENKGVRTSEIIENVKKHAKKRVSSKEILSILNTLELHGLIKKTLVSVENAPLLLWKA